VELTSKTEIEAIQPDEFARTRKREKVRRRSCSKVDAIIDKEVTGGGFDIDRVIIYNERIPLYL
jgi:hypothetical protein